MQNDKHQKTDEEICILTGTCSISPFLSSIHTVILVYLEELAFYLVELKTFGTTNEAIKENVIQIFSELITNIEYNQEKLDYSISIIYKSLYDAKELYTRLCQKNNVKPSYLKSSIKISKSFTVTQAIKQGQKFFIDKVKDLDNEQKKLFEIMLLLAKSICIYVTELKWLNADYNEAYEALLNILSLMNFEKLFNKNLEQIIEEYTKLDYNFMLKVFDAKKALFGKFIASEVNISPKPGKAILVSGNNLKELELLLEATKDKNIDVYTHGEMIIAHAFEKFKVYPNLVGHFGRGIGYSMSDFANFKGPIFLTKLSLHSIKNMYQGSVFTSDANSPKGVTIIKDNNFEPLIQATLSSEGFFETKEFKSIEVGIDEEYFIKKLHEIADKIDSNEIKHIFMVGVPNKTEAQKDYFKVFLNLLSDDCFALSFTDTDNRKNTLYINVDYSTPFVYMALNIFIQRESFTKMKSVVLYTKCDSHVIPTVFNMKYMGINDIYFTNCPSSLINPALTDWMKKTLKLKSYTSPQADFRDMIEEVSD